MRRLRFMTRRRATRTAPGASKSVATVCSNVICPNRISPIATKLLGFLPPPNITAALGQNQLRRQHHAREDDSLFDTKINYQLNEKQSDSGRLSFQRPQIFDPGSYGVYGGPANGAFAGTGTQDTYSIQGAWTHLSARAC